MKNISVCLLIIFINISAHCYTISNSWQTKANQYQGQLHCHSTRSDGTLTPDLVISTYTNLGYDFICISDHDVIVDTFSITIMQIPGIEETPTYDHINMINTVYDYPGVCTKTMLLLQNELGAFSIINHPLQDPLTDTSHSDIDILTSVGYDAIEIYNGIAGYADEKIDRMLTANRRFWIVASDDSHYANTVNLGWVIVNSDYLSIADIINNLNNGNFYCCVGSSVSISNLENDLTTITITYDTIMDSVTYNTSSGITKTVNNVATDTYSVVGNEIFVRITGYYNNKPIFAQPIFIEE